MSTTVNNGWAVFMRNRINIKTDLNKAIMDLPISRKLVLVKIFRSSPFDRQSNVAQPANKHSRCTATARARAVRWYPPSSEETRRPPQ